MPLLRPALSFLNCNEEHPHQPEPHSSFILLRSAGGSMSRRSIAHAVLERVQSFARSKTPSVITLILTLSLVTLAQTKPPPRDSGLPFHGPPGVNNAITDVKGGEVGHPPPLPGGGKMEIGKGRV